jgi:flagellum-specific ATP synthase
MHDIVPDAQFESARQLKQSLSAYEQNRDLISIGAYQRGSDPRIDAAIAQSPHVKQFLQQGIQERVSMQDSVAQLASLFGEA